MSALDEAIQHSLSSRCAASRVGAGEGRDKTPARMALLVWEERGVREQPRTHTAPADVRFASLDEENGTIFMMVFFFF